jgi:hypothetical protein
MLETGQFETIIIEGTQIPENELCKAELRRLLKANGKVYFSFGDRQCYPFSWELNRTNFDKLSSADPMLTLSETFSHIQLK